MNSNLQTTGDRTNTDIASLSNELSNNDVVSATQRDLANKLNDLDERSRKTFGTLLMRSGDRRILEELDSARAESTRIVLGSRNESLRVVGETLVRYTKAMANTHLSVLETTNASNIDGHFLSVKTELLGKLARAEQEFMEHIARKEERFLQAPASLKEAIRRTAESDIMKYMADYESITADYSAIRSKRIK